MKIQLEKSRNFTLFEQIEGIYAHFLGVVFGTNPLYVSMLGGIIMLLLYIAIKI